MVKRGQFKPGRSGNPKGRPKVARDKRLSLMLSNEKALQRKLVKMELGGDVAAMLHIGLHVGKKLAGVLVVGERVDDRNQGVCRKRFYPLVLEGAHDDGVGHA